MCHHVLTHMVLSQVISYITEHYYSSLNVCLSAGVGVNELAAIRCCASALQDGHSRVSQQCVGRHRDIIHIPTLRPTPITRVRL